MPQRPRLGDTTVVDKVVPVPGTTSDVQKSDRMYDSLEAKSNRRAFSRLLHDVLFRRPVRDTTSTGAIRDEAKDFLPYDGKTIGEITIERDQIFDKKSRGLRRYANAVHLLTQENIVRRDLLFKSGDRMDMDLIVRNEQLLRSRSYISDADIIASVNPLDTNVVDVLVRTRDSWSISFDGEWRTQNRATVEIFDENILGLGDKLSIKTYFTRSFDEYGGNMFTYNSPNILGSFFTGTFKLGRNFEERYREVGISKEFITPNDYMLGAHYSADRERYYQVYIDTFTLVRSNKVDVWSGRSWYVPGWRSSIYLSGRYSFGDFKRRPAETSKRFNPAFHDYNMALLALGVYRERFYTANLIHGFGFKEYLAAGYKAEFVGGFNWGEFTDDWYIGANFRGGGYTPIGYLMGGFDIGSSITPEDGAWWRSSLDLEAKWFSNLMLKSRTRIRQFVAMKYTRGWNRLEGSDEVVRFTRQNGPEAIHVTDFGRSRAMLNTETVFFTPYEPFGFRMAIYGFADFATLGNDVNIFKNDFYSTIGIGIRLKNERLIFRTIQFQFGIALGKKGFLHESLRLSNEPRVSQYRYRPVRPEVTPYE